MEESRLLNLVQDYHSYSCKEQAMKLLQVSTFSLTILGLGVAVKYFNSEKNETAVMSCLGAISATVLGTYTGRRGKYYANKVEDTRVELKGLDRKLTEKRDPLSLPILDKKDIAERRNKVSTYRIG